MLRQRIDKVTVNYEYLSKDQCAELKADVAEMGDNEMVEAMTWRCYNSDGTGPLKKRRPITDFDIDHLENILLTQPHLKPKERAVILVLLRRAYERGDAEQWHGGIGDSTASRTEPSLTSM